MQRIILKNRAYIVIYPKYGAPDMCVCVRARAGKKAGEVKEIKRKRATRVMQVVACKEDAKNTIGKQSIVMISQRYGSPMECMKETRGN
jgi:hypothetical protein